MENSHTAAATKKGLTCGVWFVVNEKGGKQESLNHYRINMDVADQKALQERPHNTHNIDFLEKQFNAAMKTSQLHQIYNIHNPNKFLPSHSFMVSACYYKLKPWRDIMA